MIKVGIVGATGYAGEELIEILLKHPKVGIASLSAIIDKPTGIGEIFPKFKNRIDLICKKPDLKELTDKCDLVFLALPHTVSMEIVPKLIAAKKYVIDLSADYRLADVKVYKQYYKIPHKDKANIAKAVYGLPELFRAKIKKAQLVANPGCYPTAAILSLAPLLSTDLIEARPVIIDAKSGFSGAGRKTGADPVSFETDSDFKAYKVNVHQHAPEINQELSRLKGKKVEVVFVPHLLPLERGILETIYVKPKKKITSAGLISLFRKFYKNEPFVRIKDEGEFPRIKDVVKTNFCDIGISASPGVVIIIAAIDNLLKGASGQAVQNMNIMYKFPETLSLL